MASIRRTDIMHNKGFSKGRPAKPERERNRKRQEAYKWRDARRIYLANSFDRWRKLRCSLGMKDSVLAWHLMEAHENSQCGICRRDSSKGDQETNPEPKVFLDSLIKAIKKLCYSKFQFQECINIVGLLCLEFDKSRKENFSLNETVLAKLKKDMINVSNADANSRSCASGSKVVEIVSKEGELTTKSSSLSIDQNERKNPASMVDEKLVSEAESIPAFEIMASELATSAQDEKSSQNTEETHQPVSKPTAYLQPKLEVNEEETSQEKSILGSSDDCHSSIESEAEVSLEIDVEKIDTSQEMDSASCQNNYKSSKCEISNEGLECVGKLICSSPVAVTSLGTNSIAKPQFCSVLNEFPDATQSPVTVKRNQSPIPLSSELPLDMSLEKSHSYRVKEETEVMRMSPSLGYKELSVSVFHSEQKMEQLEPGESSSPAKKMSSTPKSSSRGKDEIHPSIPWQRRDMSRKEEYEFLELNPFSDLSEFSQRYPHVHQRTYYRWKRRIKEEYIILEQCPHMSFEQFSSVVLQAKESVFNLWKSLISQGKGFFAPSDVSKRLETKCPASKAVNTLSEQYIFLQKNLSCTQEQFCQHFANTSTEVYIALKRKVLQEFWVFYHNQHLEWKEFTKLVDVSEEIHKVWKEHVSQNMKSAMACFSPNNPLFSSQYPFQNVSEAQGHLHKGNPPTSFDSTLEDSVSRGLSATYLNSVQNMMFPWASYYGVHNSLNQQLLPMMLWPRMMGLNGNSPLPMGLPNLMASSPSSSESKADSPHDLNSAQNILSHMNMADGESDNVKIHPQIEAGSFVGGKRPSSMLGLDGEISNEAEQFKKQKFKDDTENLNIQSPASKSRKQNKQEYIYYLKNPSLSFKDLETLFPTISLRTFYRWRKEMNAALLFLQENKNPDYQLFKPVFPDIPEEVFDLWKAKSGKENFAENVSFIESEPRQNENFESISRVEERRETVFPERRVKSYDNINNEEISLFGSTDAHLYVHKNPTVVYESFSQSFPGISANRFYHWKKEWKNGIEFLHANAGMSYDNYKNIDPSISEEIFETWIQFLFSEDPTAKTKRDSSSLYGKQRVEKSTEDGYSIKKSNAEFTYLQLHPQIEFQDFSKSCPNIGKDTFDIWKKEVQKIINYIGSQPSVSFEEISAVLPDVTEEAFVKWKELIASGRSAGTDVEEAKEVHLDDSKKDASKSASDFSKMSSDNEDAKTKMTNALLQLMNNPNVKYQVFSEQFPFVSIETFELWLNRIKAVIVHISSNPTLSFEEFRSAITDIGEDIFQKWKSLSPEEISSIGKQVSETKSPMPVHLSEDSLEYYRSRALYFCQENPNLAFELFSSHYPNISETDFKCWMLKISTQRSFIKDNKDLIYEDFKGIYPDIERSIFDLWKNSILADETSNFHRPLYENRTGSKDRNSTVLHCITNGETSSPSTFDNCKKEKLYDNAFVSTNPSHAKESHCEEEQESSLKKLAKLAESDPSYSVWSSRSNGESQLGESDIPNSNTGFPKEASMNPALKLGYEKNHNNNSPDTDYHSHYGTKVSSPMNFHKTDTPSNISEKAYKNMQTPDVLAPHSDEAHSQSLSALMVMSTESHKLQSFAPSPKLETNPDSGTLPFSNSGKWKYPSVSIAKDEEEPFSSQRQKKMSRAEYLFVKDNPDVDSQEFARIFPGVSARTFYRWKKEIKAQMQIA